MVLDTSAIIAILTGEPVADRLAGAIEADRARLVSAATVVEASLALLGRYGEAGDVQLDRLLRTIGAEVVPVGEEQVTLARDQRSASGAGGIRRDSTSATASATPSRSRGASRCCSSATTSR